MVDAIDSFGNVNPAGRRYEDGTYQEWDGVLEYRHGLKDRTWESRFDQGRFTNLRIYGFTN